MILKTFENFENKYETIIDKKECLDIIKTKCNDCDLRTINMSRRHKSEHPYLLVDSSKNKFTIDPQHNPTNKYNHQHLNAFIHFTIYSKVWKNLGYPIKYNSIDFWFNYCQTERTFISNYALIPLDGAKIAITDGCMFNSLISLPSKEFNETYYRKTGKMLNLLSPVETMNDIKEAGLIDYAERIFSPESINSYKEELEQRVKILMGNNSYKRGSIFGRGPNPLLDKITPPYITSGKLRPAWIESKVILVRLDLLDEIKKEIYE